MNELVEYSLDSRKKTAVNRQLRLRPNFGLFFYVFYTKIYETRPDQTKIHIYTPSTINIIYIPHWSLCARQSNEIRLLEILAEIKFKLN